MMGIYLLEKHVLTADVLLIMDPDVFGALKPSSAVSLQPTPGHEDLLSEHKFRIARKAEHSGV